MQIPEFATIIELLLDEWQKAAPKMPKLGFCFVMFNLNEDDLLAYVTDVKENKMIIEVLQKFLERLKKREANAVDS